MSNTDPNHCVRCGKQRNEHPDDHELQAVWHCPICDVDGHSMAEGHCSVCSTHPAPHKIGEEGFGDLNFHNLTARLCCEHFREIVGDCEKWPTYGHGDAERPSGLSADPQTVPAGLFEALGRIQAGKELTSEFEVEDPCPRCGEEIVDHPTLDLADCLRASPRSNDLALAPPTRSDDEWAEWQVGSIVVATGSPVCLYIEGRDGFSTEVAVPDPDALVTAVRAAQVGEWGPAEAAT